MMLLVDFGVRYAVAARLEGDILLNRSSGGGIFISVLCIVKRRKYMVIINRLFIW